ncbi:MAG: hypothetical protein IJA73_03225 [Oscillospiraceae bacterium]|nr:hypothetical protein [Oscillospiraceae bacterium]
MMNAQQAIAYIENANGGKMRLGTARVRELLRRLGDVQKKLRFVHVAGSNGKGSTCAMVESILRAAGYRTGLFTSPAVFDFREQIRVCGEWIGEEALCRLAEQVRAAAEEMDDRPTHYELLTALAMLHFACEGCEVVVLEAALGGRDDCTNVIDAPLAAVITAISLEHTKILGTTLGEIAQVKAGIIKRRCGVVCCENDRAVMEAVEGRCAQVGASIRMASSAELTALGHDLSAQRFSYRGKAYTLGLLGTHQLVNAAAALETVEVLRERGSSSRMTPSRRGLRRSGGARGLRSCGVSRLSFSTADTIRNVPPRLRTRLRHIFRDENSPLSWVFLPTRRSMRWSSASCRTQSGFSASRLKVPARWMRRRLPVFCARTVRSRRSLTRSPALSRRRHGRGRLFARSDRCI